MEEPECDGVDPVGVVQPKHSGQYESAAAESAENLSHFLEQSVLRVLLLFFECFTNRGWGIAGGNSGPDQFEDQASIRNPCEIKHFILNNIRPLTLDRLLSGGSESLPSGAMPLGDANMHIERVSQRRNHTRPLLHDAGVDRLPPRA